MELQVAHQFVTALLPWPPELQCSDGRTDGRRSEDVKDVPDVPLQGENNNLVNFMDFPNTFEGLYKDLLESNNLVQFCIRAVAV